MIWPRQAISLWSNHFHVHRAWRVKLGPSYCGGWRVLSGTNCGDRMALVGARASWCGATARRPRGSKSPSDASPRCLKSRSGWASHRTGWPAALARAEAATAVADGETVLASLASGTTTPLEEASLSERQEQVRALLTVLTPGQRVAVTRTLLEDRTLDEVATELGVSVARAGQLRLAALKKLRGQPEVPATVERTERDRVSGGGSLRPPPIVRTRRLVRSSRPPPVERVASSRRSSRRRPRCCPASSERRLHRVWLGRCRPR
jgi:hypothetical protein